MKKLPTKLKIFLISIYIITITALIVFYISGYIPVKKIGLTDFIFFVLLIALTESFTVPFMKMSFSTSFVIHLASYILFGPFITILVVIIGFSLRVLKVDNGYKHIFNTPFYGTLSNYCILILSLLVGNFLFFISNGSFPIVDIESNLLQISIFCISVFIVNNFLISVLFAIINNKNVLYAFNKNLKLVLLNIVLIAPFGVILAYVYEKYYYAGVFLLLFPIVLARYTFSLYIDAKTQYTDTVNALMLAMEARDKYTEGHSQRVADLVEAIARQLKYSDSKIEHLRMASMLHDVGKIGIDDNILNKPGKLTDEEYNIIKKHPEIGYNILKDIKNLSDVKNIVKHHHERYDGKGYPDGLDKDSISIDVFIVQLADSIDAMATDRPYRKALSEEKIISELKKYSGTQFHPKVVEAYLRLKEKQ